MENSIKQTWPTLCPSTRYNGSLRLRRFPSASFLLKKQANVPGDDVVSARFRLSPSFWDFIGKTRRFVLHFNYAWKVEDLDTWVVKYNLSGNFIFTVKMAKDSLVSGRFTSRGVHYRSFITKGRVFLKKRKKRNFLPFFSKRVKQTIELSKSLYAIKEQFLKEVFAFEQQTRVVECTASH